MGINDQDPDAIDSAKQEIENARAEVERISRDRRDTLDELTAATPELPSVPSGSAPGRHWIRLAAGMAGVGVALVIAPLFLPIPVWVGTAGVALFAVAGAPYVLAVRASQQETARLRTEQHERTLRAIIDSHHRVLASQKEQMAQLDQIHERIMAATRRIRLPHVEQEVYIEILGLDPKQVVVLEWPEDGLRDRVGVYLKDGSMQVHQFTLEQMNEAAAAINERLDEPERETPEEQP